VPAVASRLTPRAADHLARLEAAGHSVAWGLATDERTTFYWARINPTGSVTVRTVTAGDAQTLLEKADQAAAADPSGGLVASLSDPLRSCTVCGAELSFDGDSPVPFRCPLGDGHDQIREL